MRKKQILMAFNRSRQLEIEVINGLLTQVYGTLDSIRDDVGGGRVTTNVKLETLKSQLNNVLAKVLNIEYLPLENFAEQVKLRPDSVRRKLNSGELLGIKLRNKWYVRRSELWHFQDVDEAQG